MQHAFILMEGVVVSMKEIIEQAECLPFEERAYVVDSLLKTLNHPDPEIDGKWAETATRRLNELRSGRVKPVPAEEVFAKARERFGK